MKRATWSTMVGAAWVLHGSIGAAREPGRPCGAGYASAAARIVLDESDARPEVSGPCVDAACVDGLRRDLTAVRMLLGLPNFDQDCLETGESEIRTLVGRAVGTEANRVRAVAGQCESSNCDREASELRVDLDQLRVRGTEELTSLRTRCVLPPVAPRSRAVLGLLDAGIFSLGSALTLGLSGLYLSARDLSSPDTRAALFGSAGTLFVGGWALLMVGATLSDGDSSRRSPASLRVSGLTMAAIGSVGSVLGWAIAEGTSPDARVPVMVVFSIVGGVGSVVAVIASVLE